MNITILTGTFKQQPNLKNGVAYGSIKTDKMFLTFVAFGETANEVAKCNTTDTYIIEGRLTQNKYKDEWRFQIVINEIKKLDIGATPIVDDIGISGGELEDVEMSEDEDDLPF